MKGGYSYKSKWMIRILFCVVLLVLIAIALVSFVSSGIPDDENKTQLIPRDDSIYYGPDGKPGHNEWIRTGEKSFYVGNDGRLLRDRVAAVDGKEYCFAEDGQLLTDTTLIRDGMLYQCEEDGEIRSVSGWLDIDDKRYYGDADGKAICDRKIEDGGKEYYLDKEGALITDQTFIFGDNAYVADEEGVLSYAQGWVQSGENWYYAESGGKLKKNSLVDKDGVPCFLCSDGHMASSDFYIYEDVLYFAEGNGSIRKQEGWFRWEDRWYYSDADGKFLRDQYVTVENEKYYLDGTGARIVGKPAIDVYLKCNDLYGWMTSHHNDYYFKTRYRGLVGNEHQPEVLIRPYGEFGQTNCGMNCTGFIASLVYYSGGDLDRVSAMGNYGKYANADNFLKLGTRGLVEYDTFSSVKEMLESGKVHKGDILYLSPAWRADADCHMGVFWGDTPSDNQFWSQTLVAKCTVSEIFMVDPIAKIYRFPISANQETVYYTGATP